MWHLLLAAAAGTLAVRSTGSRVCLETAEGHAYEHESYDELFVSGCERWLESPGDTRFRSVAVLDAVCAVTVGGQASCYGDAGLSRGVPNRAFLHVDVGRAHACGLTTDGPVLCWGEGPAAHLPPHLEGLHFSSVVAGDYHACALLASDGTVHCWGDGSVGQIDVPSETKFVDVHVARPAARTPGGDGYDELQTSVVRFLSIDAGALHTCGIRLDHSIVCWGDDAHRQLEAPPGVWAQALSAGGYHSCTIERLDMAQRVRLEADLAQQQALGDTELIKDAQNALERFLASVAQKEEAAKATNDPVVKNTTRVICWGEDSKFRLAPPDLPTPPRRHFFGGLLPFCATSPSNPYCGAVEHEMDGHIEDFRGVAVGAEHACVLLGDNGEVQPPDAAPGGYEDRGYELPRSHGSTVLCWGSDVQGQSRPPHASREGGPYRNGYLFVAVASGQDTTCGIAHDRRLFCWGRMRGTPLWTAPHLEHFMHDPGPPNFFAQRP